MSKDLCVTLIVVCSFGALYYFLTLLFPVLIQVPSFESILASLLVMVLAVFYSVYYYIKHFKKVKNNKE